MHPQCICAHSFHLHIPTIASLLGIQTPRDFTLMVEGGIQAGDEILVDGQSCLTFYLCPDLIDHEGASSEPPSGSEPDERPTDDSSRSDGSHPDSAFDSRPGSRSSTNTTDNDNPPACDNPQECQYASALCPAPRRSASCAGLARAAKGTPAWCLPRKHLSVPPACSGYLSMINSWPSPGTWGSFGHFLGRPPRCAAKDPLFLSLMCPSGFSGISLVPHGDLCFETTRAPYKTSKHLSPVQAKQPDNPGIRTDQGVILPDILARVPAPPGPRDGPRFPIDTGQVAQDIALGRQIEDDPWIHAMFLTMPPDTVAEVLGIPLQAPCTVQDALAAVEQVRDEANSGMYPELFVAEPQPSRLFACILAAPAWAQHLCTILVDTRSFNGALFAVATSSRLNRESLLLAAGLHVSDQIQVFCGTSLQPLAPWQIADLTSGMTVTFYPVRLPAPRRALLEEMLQSTLLWDPDADIPSPAGMHFLLLTDGMPVLFALQPQRGRYHREDISQALHCDEHGLTIQPSLPRQQDVLFKGHHVRAVCVATTAISRIPVPPGRLLPPSYLLFLDCRPILLSFQWLLLSAPEVTVQRLVDRYDDLCPEGFIVSVTGAEVENRDTGAVFRLRNAQLLRVEFVQDSISDTDSGESSDLQPISTHNEADLSDAPSADLRTRGPSSDRSRSPSLGYCSRKTHSQVLLGPMIQLGLPLSWLTYSIRRVPRRAVSFLLVFLQN